MKKAKPPGPRLSTTIAAMAAIVETNHVLVLLKDFDTMTITITKSQPQWIETTWRC